MLATASIESGVHKAAWIMSEELYHYLWEVRWKSTHRTSVAIEAERFVSLRVRTIGALDGKGLLLALEMVDGIFNSKVTLLASKMFDIRRNRGTHNNSHNELGSTVSGETGL